MPSLVPSLRINPAQGMNQVTPCSQRSVNDFAWIPLFQSIEWLLGKFENYIFRWQLRKYQKLQSSQHTDKGLEIWVGFCLY